MGCSGSFHPGSPTPAYQPPGELQQPRRKQCLLSRDRSNSAVFGEPNRFDFEGSTRFGLTTERNLLAEMSGIARKRPSPITRRHAQTQLASTFYKVNSQYLRAVVLVWLARTSGAV